MGRNRHQRFFISPKHKMRLVNYKLQIFCLLVMCNCHLLASSWGNHIVHHRNHSIPCCLEFQIQNYIKYFKFRWVRIGLDGKVRNLNDNFCSIVNSYHPHKQQSTICKDLGKLVHCNKCVHEKKRNPMDCKKTIPLQSFLGRLPRRQLRRGQIGQWEYRI